MTLTEKLKNEIDEMPYTDMLRKWRHSELGDPLFQDDSGEYFAQVMTIKKHALTPSERVQASKAVGW